MAQTYYAQNAVPTRTMTVGELVEKLLQFDPNELVVFRTPLYGVFGSNTAYSVDDVAKETLSRKELHTPASIQRDEETGQMCTYEEDTQVFHEWSGVVIT